MLVSGCSRYKVRMSEIGVNSTETFEFLVGILLARVLRHSRDGWWTLSTTWNESSPSHCSCDHRIGNSCLVASSCRLAPRAPDHNHPPLHQQKRFPYVEAT